MLFCLQVALSGSHVFQRGGIWGFSTFVSTPKAQPRLLVKGLVAHFKAFDKLQRHTAGSIDSIPMHM